VDAVAAVVTAEAEEAVVVDEAALAVATAEAEEAVVEAVIEEAARVEGTVAEIATNKKRQIKDKQKQARVTSLALF